MCACNVISKIVKNNMLENSYYFAFTATYIPVSGRKSR